MSQTKAAEPAGEKANAPKKKGKGMLLVIIAVVVVAAGGGGAAYWKFGMAKAAPAHAAEAETPAAPETEPSLAKFDPFVVNLADGGGQAYLRVSLSLLVASDADAKHLAEKEVTRTRVRSAILETLSTQTAAQLMTPDGKSELKRVITERITSLNEPIDVRDVLFTDFVVQY